MSRDIDQPGASTENPATSSGPEGPRDAGEGHLEFISLDTSFDMNEEFLSEADYAHLAPASSMDSQPELANVATAEASAERVPLAAGWQESLPAGTALSISELLENEVTIDWREAVAIARSICDAIARHPSAGTHEYLLDPRHIEITERGDVHVMPGAPGGDPFVKQVGRILRALLENGSAPAPLRLLASQASFELTGFATLQDLSEALRSFDAPLETEAIRTAFKRGREAKFSQAAAADWSRTSKPAAPEPVVPVAWSQVVPRRPPWRGRLKLVTVGVSLALVALAAFELTRTLIRPGSTPASAVGRTPVPPLRPDANQPAVSVATSPTPVIAPGPALESKPVPASRPQLPRADQETPSASPRTAASGNRPRVESPVAVVPVLPAATDRDDALRRKFDALVLSNPLYRLDGEQTTPEAVTALRESKRLLLPSLAKRDADRAREALDQGDVDRALSEVTRATAILDDPDVGPVPSVLRETVRQLLARARAARTSEEGRIYTAIDVGIVPPLPLGRQLPATGPSGISAELVGQLELLIGRNGEVEAVKLHTPLNRYHERMIVSAAKAWRYEPATKDGKSVRFRLYRSVTLPED
jgi:hypothetical protein